MAINPGKNFNNKRKRKNNMKKIRILSIIATVILMGILTSCSSDKKNTVFSKDDLSGKKIGVQLGTTGDTYCKDMEKDGSGTEIERYNKGSDAIQSLKNGTIDAVVIDEQPAKAFVDVNEDLMILDEEFIVEDYAICLSKSDDKLTESINDAINDLKAEGILDDINNNYIGEEKGKSPYISPDGIEYTNGTLVMATNAFFKPYEYYDDGKIVGIDVELGTAIADRLGMKLEVKDMEFDSIITAIQSGKADIGISGMTVTEDRLKNVNFSIPYTTSMQVIVVRNDDSSAKKNSIVEKFKNDFIVDGRYKYLLTGLKNTLIIVVFAAIIGIMIGFLLAVIRSAHDKNGGFTILNAAAQLYTTVIRGTPAMVQLLIIYYIIFAPFDVNKILVAVMAFGINSGAYVSEIIRSGIMSIDNGQFEASRSLGLTFPQTMVSVVLPQAFKNVLPALANEFIVLLKETSICGYIGLNDVTRGGDIIRSITYDAYLPLLSVAAIYLVLVMVLTFLVKKLERRLRTNERN